MKRLILVDASLDAGEAEAFILRLPDSEPGLHVLFDDEPSAAMVLRFGDRISGVRDPFPPSGRRERELLGETRDIVRAALESDEGRRYAELLGSARLPDLESTAYESRFGGVFPALCLVTAIRDQLKREVWERVEIFSTLGLMAEAFSIASSLETYGGESVEIVSRKPLAIWRRFKRRVGRRLRDRLAVPSLLREFLSGWMHRAGRKSRRDLPLSPEYLFCVHPSESVLYISTLAPLIQEAAGQDRAVALVDWRNVGGTTAESFGVAARHPSDFFSVADYGRTVVDLFRLKRAWNSSLSGGRATTLFSCCEVPLWPLIDWTVHRDWFRQIFWLSVWQRAVWRIIRSGSVKGIVHAVDNSSQAWLAASIAEKAGILSYYVQPALQADSGGVDGLRAQHCFVIDQFSKQVFLNLGVNADRLHVEGLTRWDRLSERISPSDSKSIRRRLGINPEQPLLLFVGSRGPITEKIGLISAVLEIAEVVPGIHICVRPHPGDAKSDYRKFFPGYRTEVLSMFPPDLDLHDFILAADLTVTGFSNVAVEAGILNRPVLTINLRGEPDVLPLESEGIAFAARSSEEVKSQAARFFGDEDFRQELESRRERYFKSNPELRTAGVAERILSRMDRISNGSRDEYP